VAAAEQWIALSDAAARLAGRHAARPRRAERRPGYCSSRGRHAAAVGRRVVAAPAPRRRRLRPGDPGHRRDDRAGRAFPDFGAADEPAAATPYHARAATAAAGRRSPWWTALRRYGQQLDIERGNLHFRGLLDNPALDVRAMRRGPAVEAGVEIGGNAKKPVVRLVSEPEVPDAEKLSWLVLGHGSEQMGSGDATVLLSAAGGLLGNDAGGLVQQLKRGFGINELGVRQGDIGGSGGRLPTSRVAGSGYDAGASTGQQIFSIGKRLSANALLSYEQALGRAESVVKLTVDLSRQVSVVGRAGSDNALDVFYTLSFPRAPRTKP
jgi:hypothetical protein